MRQLAILTNNLSVYIDSLSRFWVIPDALKPVQIFLTVPNISTRHLQFLTIGQFFEVNKAL